MRLTERKLMTSCRRQYLALGRVTSTCNESRDTVELARNSGIRETPYVANPPGVVLIRQHDGRLGFPKGVLNGKDRGIPTKAVLDKSVRTMSLCNCQPQEFPRICYRQDAQRVKLKCRNGW
jgi:hypothetical protein